MSAITLQIGHGARQTEARLLEAVLTARRSVIARHGPLGGATVAVIVPSHSLRLHVLRVLSTRSAPETAVGISCLTAYALARQLSDLPPRELPETMELLCERFARRHQGLGALAALHEGFTPVYASVRDLLDAGLRPELAESLLEVLDLPQVKAAGRAATTRVRALIEVAARTDAALETLKLPSRHAIFRQATEALQRDDCHPLETVVVHGFAEATGVVSDFLEALLRRWGGRVLLSAPPDPVQPDIPAGGGVFVRRLRERVELLGADQEEAGRQEIVPPRLRLVHAPDPDSEVESVAQRIRDLLDGGRMPEEIGVVMRDVTPYRAPLWRRFTRLGIPFSAPGVGGSSLPSQRWYAGLLALLDQGQNLPVERWLELIAPTNLECPPLDLALVLSARGVARLGQVAQLGAEHAANQPDTLPLPLPRLQPAMPSENDSHDDQDDDDAEDRLEDTATRPSVPRRALEQLRGDATALLQHLRTWSEEGRLNAHRDALRRLLIDRLAWPVESMLFRDLDRHVFRPLGGLPDELPVDYDEFRRLLARLLSQLDRSELGGRGAGVQVMDVMNARARTFRELFLLGLNQGNFPRTVREDALLPDVVRDALAASGHGPLPDLSRKRAGFDEEIHLFAELLSAAPEVQLSWAEADAVGEAQSPSPWIERLRSALGLHVELASALWADPTTASTTPEVKARRLRRRPAEEWARLAGLYADRSAFVRVLSHAVAEVEATPGAEARERAAVRRAVLDELDPDFASRRGPGIWKRLGPYSGVPGRCGWRQSGDQPFWVTELEAVARCPWQAFLQRDLKLEPWPDPLTTLPDLDPRIVGSTVHDVLQAIAPQELQGQPEQPSDPLSVEPSPVPWPTEAELRRSVRRAATATLAREGMLLPGLVHGLTARAMPLLQHARELAWSDGIDLICAVEVSGEARAGGHLVRFRVDQIREEEGRRELIDFKTGRPLADNKKESTRRKHLLRAVSEGRALQAAIYARAAGAGSLGVYLYLSEQDVGFEEARRIAVEPGDEAVMKRLDQVVDLLAAAQLAGVQPPRLNQRPEGNRERPRMCSECAVAQACLQHDSVARSRQRQWVDAHSAPAPGERSIQNLAAALWWMPPPTGDDPRIDEEESP